MFVKHFCCFLLLNEISHKTCTYDLFLIRWKIIIINVPQEVFMKCTIWISTNVTYNKRIPVTDRDVPVTANPPNWDFIPRAINVLSAHSKMQRLASRFHGENFAYRYQIKASTQFVLKVWHQPTKHSVVVTSVQFLLSTQFPKPIHACCFYKRPQQC